MIVNYIEKGWDYYAAGARLAGGPGGHAIAKERAAGEVAGNAFGDRRP